jgi:hypothetical protein
MPVVWDVLDGEQYLGYIELSDGKYHPTSDVDGQGGHEYMLMSSAAGWLREHYAEKS